MSTRNALIALSTIIAICFVEFLSIKPPDVILTEEQQRVMTTPKEPPPTWTPRILPHYPLVMAAPLPPQNNYNTTTTNNNDLYINLMEHNDGILNTEACLTWKHTNDQGPYKKFNCKLEWDEWMLVNAFVEPGDVVLEFGARFGTTSCMLARAAHAGQHTSSSMGGHVVAIEVDSEVHTALLDNLHTHKCHVHAVLGTVSPHPLYIAHAPASRGYALFTSNQPPNPGAAAIPSISVSTIEAVLERRITVALIDCEGCIDSVEANGLFGAPPPSSLSGPSDTTGVDLILMEEDRVEGVDYSLWHIKLTQTYGYRCLWYTQDSTFGNLRHSVWMHTSALKKRKQWQSCTDYVQAQPNFVPNQQIKCLECPPATKV